MTGMLETSWPKLAYADWSDTCETLHMWTQVVGKVRMLKTPPINHWWHVPLYITSKGIGTSPIPDGDRTFDVDFDFLEHRLCITTTDGHRREIALRPMTVADFYGRFMNALSELKIDAPINTTPSEVANPIPFEKDVQHASYDADAVTRFWRVLVNACQLFTQFRSEFIGKVSPVHLFWGGFDLAVTRFSGRPAPPHPGAPGLPLKVQREAYSHEVSSLGFWPGTENMDAAFYAYAYPEPEGFGNAAVKPKAAFYHKEMREFFLPYESVRKSDTPSQDILDFARSTYEPAAALGHWPREALERL